MPGTPFSGYSQRLETHNLKRFTVSFFLFFFFFKKNNKQHPPTLNLCTSAAAAFKNGCPCPGVCVSLVTVQGFLLPWLGSLWPGEGLAVPALVPLPPSKWIFVFPYSSREP